MVDIAAVAAVKPQFAAKIRASEQCWEWTGFRDPDGYGVVMVTVAGKKIRGAHRAMYSLVHGGIPAGLVVHHTCGNKGCVNPSHLEAVTQRENVLRGISFAARNAAKDTCVKGHLFDEANTHMWHGQRGCRKCRNAATAAYRKRRAAL